MWFRVTGVRPHYVAHRSFGGDTPPIGVAPAVCRTSEPGVETPPHASPFNPASSIPAGRLVYILYSRRRNFTSFGETAGRWSSSEGSPPLQTQSSHGHGPRPIEAFVFIISHAFMRRNDDKLFAVHYILCSLKCVWKKYN